MNGRYFVRLDPEGYKYAKEPGLDFLINGDELLSKFDPDPKAVGGKAHKFWCPPDSKWVRGLPLQFDPEWYRNDELDKFVLRANRWTFAPGVTPTEWELNRIPGTSYPKNQWISIHVPDAATSLDARDYETMAQVAGANIPAGLITVGFCGTTPAGANFSLFDFGLTPFLQWINYPAPHNAFVFGFGQIGVICYQDNYFILHTPDHDGQGWLLLDKGKLSSLPPDKASPAGRQGSASLLQAQAARAEIRSLLAHTAGPTDLFLIPGVGEPKGVTLRRKPAVVNDTPLKAGPFWVAGMRGQQLGFQCQIVGYHAADSTVLNTPTPQIWFDLSEHYKPSVAPAFGQDALVTGKRDGTPTSTAVEEDGTVYIHNVDSGQEIRYGLHDQTGNPWDFEAGETYKGSLFLKLTPGWTGGPEPFLSPEVAHLELRFPVVLADRVCQPLLLDDLQFDGLEVETALRDPLAKRLTVSLTDRGLQTLSATGHDARANYPIHIEQDTDGDGVPDTVRAAGWVKKIRVDEVAARVNGARPLLQYQIEAHGLLSRGDQRWQFLPQMINPQSDPPGTVEHSFAVEQTVRSMGIDTSDPVFWLAQTDPYRGRDIARLPGTWGLKSGQIGHVEKNAWGPTWKQTKVGYAAETGRHCRGWLLYETLGRTIRYHDDLQRELQRGAKYVVSGALYATPEDAAAAGVPYQVYLSMARGENIEPQGNIIRISGEDSDLTICPQVMERDGLSIAGPVDYPHFVGEPLVWAREPRQAVDVGAMQVQCRLLMERIGRRQSVWIVGAELSPWDLVPQAVDVGYVLRVEGLGDFQIDHLEWRLIKSEHGASYCLTTFALASLPVGAQTGPGGGAYPGRASEIVLSE